MASPTFRPTSRVLPHYYNRSTWDQENYNEALAYLQQIFTPEVRRSVAASGHTDFFCSRLSELRGQRAAMSCRL